MEKVIWLAVAYALKAKILAVFYFLVNLAGALAIVAVAIATLSLLGPAINTAVNAFWNSEEV